MTVSLKDGKAPWPLAAIISVALFFVTTLGGATMYIVQRSADIEHRIISQNVAQLSHELVAVEDITTSNTHNISDMKSDIAVIKEILLEIEKRFK
jgi:predicted  nucleic acid-binding Zn-ribbon protein